MSHKPRVMKMNDGWRVYTYTPVWSCGYFLLSPQNVGFPSPKEAWIDYMYIINI